MADERKVIFAFVQRMLDGHRERFFHCIDDVPGHCPGSTVSETALRRAGMAVPEEGGGDGERA